MLRNNRPAAPLLAGFLSSVASTCLAANLAPLITEDRLAHMEGAIARSWAVLGIYNPAPKRQGIVRFETCGINHLLRSDRLKIFLNYLSGQHPAPAPGSDRLIGRLQLIFRNPQLHPCCT